MKTVNIKLEEIQDPKFQPRAGLEVEGIESLSKSIEEIGLINPVVVRQTDSGYELIAGTRRYHAHKMLGRESIPAKVIKGDEREAALLQWSENFHRQDLNPIEQAAMLLFMIDELKYSTAELASFCNKSREWISRSLSLLDLDDAVQDAVRQGRLSPSVANELRVISDKPLRDDYIHYAIEGGCTEKQARDWARQAKATIAARDARQQAAASPSKEEEQKEYQPPPPVTCFLCGAPEDQVKLESIDLCWHCQQKLKAEK